MPSPPSNALGSDESEGKGAESIPVLVLAKSPPGVVVVAAAAAVVELVAGALDVALASSVFEDFFDVVDSKSNCRACRTGVGLG